MQAGIHFASSKIENRRNRALSNAISFGSLGLDAALRVRRPMSTSVRASAAPHGLCRMGAPMLAAFVLIGQDLARRQKEPDHGLRRLGVLKETLT